MVVSAVFIMDLNGKVIISRNYRGDIPMTVADTFKQIIATAEEGAPLTPVIPTEEGYSFVYITHSNLLLVAVTKRNSNAMMILTFLYSLVKVMIDYFRVLEEESIRDNFVIVYELMDEMMDFGYPQHTDSQLLKKYIMNESHKMEARPPVELTNAVSWRVEGIKHKKDEVFLDVIEKLNLLVSNTGTVLHSEIIGTLKMKSFLSGMPELKLGLNDRLLFQSRNPNVKSKTVEMDDIRFHQCVRLARFEQDRTISFIPPDGEFELMSYRLDTQVRPLFWVECKVQPHSRSRVEYMVKAKSSFKRKSSANNVKIIIPVPSDADSPQFKASVGTVEYIPEKNSLVWNIKQFPGQREYLMRAEIGLPSVEAEESSESRPPIRVEFEIPYFTVSGIQVRYLKIIEKSGYQALPWVRYITQNGEYALRMN
ncbi:MHD domain-containing protein [Plasmodiophora brassicae]|uniref:MHD domain-containing protein n=1 Tax=Plasmodiophora brassicae TaxID=37360 RepID=A0A3P3Y259_PLABS|nr:unnamed protein product [Plasmodiophora brassicae]